jgi:tryptophan halogenase
MTKVAIVGAGNAGCISALNLHYINYVDGNSEIEKIDLYYNPDCPIEKVGQGTPIPIRSTLFNVLGMNWYDKNYIGSTIKTGILYKNWGKSNHEFVHDFPGGSVAIHYVPNLLSKVVLESGLFNVIEKDVKDPDSEIDADFIMDCRGRLNKLDDSYETLTNPLNSVILANKPERDSNLTYTDCIATPNGWTFVIPNIDSVSYGYLYNNTITTKEEAEKDFIDRFDVKPSDYLNFNNYISKKLWVSERTMLNGNRFSFIEPLEATASGVHMFASEFFYDVAMGKMTIKNSEEKMRDHIKENQDFILWHYMNGSKYDTPFWEYAKSLKFSNEEGIKFHLNRCLGVNNYTALEHPDEYQFGQWSALDFKNWYDNVGGI